MYGYYRSGSASVLFDLTVDEKKKASFNPYT